MIELPIEFQLSRRHLWIFLPINYWEVPSMTWYDRHLLFYMAEA